LAKLYAELEDERGVEVHKIGRKELCARFYYGSRERPQKALTVCMTVKPEDTEEKVEVFARFLSPQGIPIHFHEEEYPLYPRPLLIRKSVP